MALQAYYSLYNKLQSNPAELPGDFLQDIEKTSKKLVQTSDTGRILHQANNPSYGSGVSATLEALLRLLRVKFRHKQVYFQFELIAFEEETQVQAREAALLFYGLFELFYKQIPPPRLEDTLPTNQRSISISSNGLTTGFQIAVSNPIAPSALLSIPAGSIDSSNLFAFPPKELSIFSTTSVSICDEFGIQFSLKKEDIRILLEFTL